TSVVTQLEGDAADSAALNAGLITLTLAEGDTNDDFIWSDLSDVDHTNTEFGSTVTDYLNGYLVSGLSSSNTASQTVSK
ncbi:hypothetical protein KJ866_02605, partial [Patescibacteria group bacterium]|nr:hypothetical protein [Patescibacteria group bacterium]